MPSQKETGTTDVLKSAFESEQTAAPEIRLRALGKELVNRFFMLYRTTRMHALENEATSQAIAIFLSSLRTMNEFSESTTLTAVEDSLYVNRTLLKPDFSSFENFRFVLSLFDHFRLGAIQFANDMPEDELKTFLKKLLEILKNPGLSIFDYAFPSLHFFRPGDLSEAEESDERRVSYSDPGYLLRIYFKGILFVTEYLESLKTGEFMSTQRLQRVTHELIDAMGADPAQFLALSTIRSADRIQSFQAVNVELLSLWMGKLLHMNNRQLSDLGLSALLHDIGKSHVPAALLAKTGPLSETEKAEIGRTPTLSLLQMIRMKGFNESTLKRMLVAYEHTMDVGEEPSARRPTIFSRIVAIAKCYVAMTTPQPYRDALLPNEAFKLMRKEEKKKFDPFLLSVFFRMMGAHPPASVVQLSNREVGVVMDRLPRVRVLYDPAGNKVKTEPIDPKSNRVTIQRILDPARLHVNTLFHFFPITA